MAVVTTENYVGLNLGEILEVVLFELGQVSGTTTVYTKFPRWFLVRKLNDRQNKFVFHSKCIRKTALLLLKADRRTYKLPENCIEGGIIGMPKYYSSSTEYVNLPIKSTQWLDENYEGWLVESSSDPMFCFLAESYGNIPMLGVYPNPDTDGTNYTSSPDTGIVIGGDVPTTSSNISGSATGGGSATSLQDSATTFTSLGLVAGMTVLNVTDGSSAAISSVAAHTITTTSLSGGSDNTWTAGDSYQILAGEYGVITSWTDDDTAFFASEVGEINTITVPAGNIRVDYTPYPLSFPETGNDLQYPEIPKLYHMDLAMGVVADCLRTFTEGSKEFQRAGFYEAIFNQSAGIGKMERGKRPFEKVPSGFSPGKSWKDR